MEKLDLMDASDAVSSMQALRTALAAELDDIETDIRELELSCLAPSDGAVTELEVYRLARAALYSGLASIDEVLGWVQLTVQKDRTGMLPELVQSLPKIPVFSIH